MTTSGPQTKQNVSTKPLIPEKYLDVPSQRLYYLSLGLLCQVPTVLLSFHKCSSLIFQSPSNYLTLYGRLPLVKHELPSAGSGYSQILSIVSFCRNCEYRDFNTAEQRFSYRYCFCGLSMVYCSVASASIFQRY